MAQSVTKRAIPARGEGCVKGEEENNKRFGAIRYETGDARPKGKALNKS